MPTYGYKCEDGHEYDLIQGFDAETTHPCQECGKEAVRQLFAPAVHFSGSGWTKSAQAPLEFNPEDGYSKVSRSVKEKEGPPPGA